MDIRFKQQLVYLLMLLLVLIVLRKGNAEPVLNIATDTAKFSASRNIPQDRIPGLEIRFI